MAYLRTPLSTPERTAMLPRAVQLISSSSSRLEALLELRDEASYLNLAELHKLCTEEIQKRDSVYSHTRVGSSGSLRSVHTFREQDSSHQRYSVVTHHSAPAAERNSMTSSAYSTLTSDEPVEVPVTFSRRSHSGSVTASTVDVPMPVEVPVAALARRSRSRSQSKDSLPQTRSAPIRTGAAPAGWI